MMRYTRWQAAWVFFFFWSICLVLFICIYLILNYSYSASLSDKSLWWTKATCSRNYWCPISLWQHLHLWLPQATEQICPFCTVWLRNHGLHSPWKQLLIIDWWEMAFKQPSNSVLCPFGGTAQSKAWVLHYFAEFSWKIKLWSLEQ